MGRRKYPPLTPSEVEAIMRGLGFELRTQVGSHKHYERAAEGKRPRSLVSIDMHYKEFDDDLLKSMISQSNFTRDEFYGATKRTARKASVKYLRLAGAEVEID